MTYSQIIGSKELYLLDNNCKHLFLFFCCCCFFLSFLTIEQNWPRVASNSNIGSLRVSRDNKVQKVASPAIWSAAPTNPQTPLVADLWGTKKDS